MAHLLRTLGMVLATGLVSSLPSAAFANLVLDGGFESPATSGTFTTYNVGAMGNWTVDSGSVDLIANYWQPASGSQSLDVAGNINGKIEQTIATTPGQAYLLTFDMSGNPDGSPTIKHLLVDFGGTSQIFTFDTTGVTRQNMKWTLMSWNVVATGSSTVLSFEDVDSPTTPYGAALDNVSLVPVPEPATAVAAGLMLLPLGASALRVLRSKRAP